MATDILDLWGEDIHVDVLSPATILHAQAEAIGKKTRGIIVGELSAQRLRDLTTLLFDLRAPTLGSLRVRVLTVTHHTNVAYPVVVTAQNLKRNIGDPPFPKGLLPSQDIANNTLSAYTQQEFTDILETIIRSKEIRALIEGILAKGNESQSKLAVPTEVLDQDEQQK